MTDGEELCCQAKVAAMGASVDLLLNRKAVLERELVDLLNRHEELSTDLPWHMQHVRTRHPCQAPSQCIELCSNQLFITQCRLQWLMRRVHCSIDPASRLRRRR